MTYIYYIYMQQREIIVFVFFYSFCNVAVNIQLQYNNFTLIQLWNPIFCNKVVAHTYTCYHLHTCTHSLTPLRAQAHTHATYNYISTNCNSKTLVHISSANYPKLDLETNIEWRGGIRGTKKVLVILLIN